MITTLTGDNTYIRNTELDRLTLEFLENNDEMALERIAGDEAEYQQIVEAIQNLPFLSAEKMVILKNPGANKQFAEKFAELLDSVPELIHVIIIEPKPDKRSKYYKDLKKLTDFKEFVETDVRDLPKWVVGAAKTAGGSISTADANYLVDRVGADQQMLSSELNKLLTHDTQITRGAIDQLTPKSLSSTTFQLLDAAFSGDSKKVVEIYNEQRSQKVEPQAIIGLLGWQLYVLAIIKTGEKANVVDISKEARLNPYVVRKSSNIARKITYSRLKELIEELRKIDQKIKTKTVDADELLTSYLISIF